jgi:hypothetical protein
MAVAAVGQNRVSPSEYLSPSAQAISSNPAPRSASQPLTALSSLLGWTAIFCQFRKQAPASVRLVER